MNNKYSDIINYWIKLEFFNPVNLPSGKNVLLDCNFPLKNQNFKEVQIDKNQTVEYVVFCGIFKVKEVTEKLKKLFNDNSEDINESNNLTCLASLRLDAEENYIPESFGLSSLPWALSKLSKDKSLDSNWTVEFEDFVDDLKREFEEDIDEVNTKTIKELIKKVFRRIDWEPKNTVNLFKVERKVRFLSKQEKKQKEKKKQIDDDVIEEEEKIRKTNPDILNSFYTKDLEAITSDIKSINKSLTKYLNGCLNLDNDKKTDLSKNTDYIKTVLKPDNFPLASWPSEHTLSLMQQFGVNQIFKNQINNKLDVFSMNGPPGTGKTTLLRDIIAELLQSRASQLVKYDNPEDAFSVLRKKSLDGYDYNLYKVDNAITDFGIVVASSNNKAVENVSKELPLIKEIGSYYDHPNADYFTEVAQNFNKDYWGLIASVLGKMENRSEFVAKAWFNGNTLKKYFENHEVNSIDWEQTREEFNEAKNKVLKLRESINKYCIDIERKENLEFQIQEINKILEDKYEVVRDLNTQIDKLSEKRVGLISESINLKSRIEDIKNQKPGFFKMIFNRNIRKQYYSVLNNIQSKFFDANLHITNVESERSELESKKVRVIEQINNQKVELDNSLVDLENIENKIKIFRENNLLKDEVIPDTNYWQRINSDEVQLSNPWQNEVFHKAQIELFFCSLKLHKAFIFSALKMVKNNFILFFNYLKGNLDVNEEEAQELWNTLFLIIPVVSTTFASYRNLFHPLKQDSIPWLFIDEAGQAVPQSSAGAIFRSKRAIVVGDPQQIEPVVGIPNSVSNFFRDKYNLDETQTDLQLSVQVMADRQNDIGTYISTMGNDIWVGSPLTVHRRCINPMFSIANKIAYDNLMVYGTNEKKVNNVKPSYFLDISGNCSEKYYVKEQGDAIRQILINEFGEYENLRKLFIISPFKNVAYNLSSHIWHDINRVMKTKFKDAHFIKTNNWLSEHLGTIHTFQGKQTDTVIMCLGADSNSEGAVNWASSRPNLLNVSLTRAKYRFIAIGDKDLWLKKPFFKELTVLEIK